jgi:uncharacterized protein with von Willebrand factor type A (vWA) domain
VSAAGATGGPLERLVEFAELLRALGVEVSHDRLQVAARALAAVDLRDRTAVHAALRAALLARADEIDAFERAFRAFFEGERETRPAEQLPQLRPVAADDGDGQESEEGRLSYSPVERLRQADFSELTPDELDRLRPLIARLGRRRPQRRSRRLRPSPRQAAALDARQTLRRALRSGGVPVERAFRRRARVPRRLVFLCDVSGSMEPYARATVLFLQALTASGRSVESFAFGTRLTRLTRELRGRDTSRALQRAAGALPDRGGGTRIGESLAAYNRRYGRRSLTRGAVVVIVSDGWEQGDLDQLDREMAAVHLSAHTVIWVNPLKARPGFEPLAGGMAISLRHTDRFLPGHNLAALESLAEVLAAA